MEVFGLTEWRELAFCYCSCTLCPTLHPSPPHTRDFRETRGGEWQRAAIFRNRLQGHRTITVYRVYNSCLSLVSSYAMPSDGAVVRNCGATSTYVLLGLGPKRVQRWKGDGEGETQASFHAQGTTVVSFFMASHTTHTGVRKDFVFSLILC